jgi:hypothetical protein
LLITLSLTVSRLFPANTSSDSDCSWFR